MAVFFQHLTDEQLRHELRGFPSITVEAALTLQANAAPAQVSAVVVRILSFYLPRGAEADLTAQPDAARLREDLGIDSLALSEAAFKLEELFDMRVENAELAEMQTLGDLRKFAERRLLDR